MVKYLFVCRTYLGVKSANGICVDRLVNEMKKRKIGVDILCVAEGDKREELLDEYTTVYTISSSNCSLSWVPETKLDYFKYYFNKIQALPFFPVESLNLQHEYKKRLLELLSQENYRAIIAVQFPAESVKAVCNCCGEIPVILYELDSVVDDPSTKIGYKKLLYPFLLLYRRYTYNKADTIIRLVCNMKKKNEISRWSNKIVVSDIPLLEKKEVESFVSLQRDKEGVRMLYSGVLESSYRNPRYLIELLLDIGKTMNLTCSFFSRGNCEDYLSSIEKKSGEIIRQKGYVDESILNSEIEQTDFLVSIGNTYSSALPSKIFMYMSKAKPIIHLTKNNEDPCIKYLNQYPAAFILYEYEDYETNKNLLLSFIEKWKRSTFETDCIYEQMKQNTPAYTVDLITDRYPLTSKY